MVSNRGRLPDGVLGGFSVSLGCSTAKGTSCQPRLFNFNAAVKSAYSAKRLSRGLLGEGAPAPCTNLPRWHYPFKMCRDPRHT